MLKGYSLNTPLTPNGKRGEHFLTVNEGSNDAQSVNFFRGASTMGMQEKGIRVDIRSGAFKNNGCP